MTLIKEAERAEDIADALGKFRASLTDQRAELALVVEDFNALSRAIRGIDDLSKSQYSKNRPLVQEDLDVVVESIEFTLEDIWARIGTIGHGAPRLTDFDYRATWKAIHRSVAQSGKRSLTERLELYRLFLDELGKIMRRRPISQRQIQDFRFDIRDLLAAQDRRMIPLTGTLEDLSLTPVQKRSYERERDPSSPTSSRDNSIPPWVASPPLSPEPLSPTTTFSTTFSTASRVSNTLPEMADGHWALDVFRDCSATPLEPSDEEAKCHGPVMPDAIAHLNKDNMLQILKIGFGSHGVHVYLFIRDSDHRARIMCETPDLSGHCWYSCVPFNMIHMRRSRSMITLYSRVSSTNTFVPWANLPFTSMERLVLFYNTCLALRSQDNHKPTINIADHELKGEICPFAGQIVDDGYHHALRIYRDKYSKAVRLQASVYGGALKNTPVWTAFITDSFVSRNWMRLEDRKVICFRSLRRHIFAPRYRSPVHPDGAHKLDFMSTRDAEDFFDTIEELARTYR